MPQELMTRLREGCARHLVVVMLVALVVVEALSLAALTRAPSQPDIVSYTGEEQGIVASQPVFRISEICSPRIDDGAAMIIVQESAPATDEGTADCFTLPASIWMFLVAAYAALLIFNFSYTFERATGVQWFWEVLYTFLAIVGWYAWDECRTAPWFPFAIVKFGLITFASYAYLLEKKLLEREKAEKTESMF